MIPAEVQSEPGVRSVIWKVSSVAMLGSFLSQLDATVVNVSLSSLATQLHSGLSVIQWVTTGYLLALALVLPLSGWLVDRIGAKALYLWCFSAFTLTSALCGLAWSANSLIAFRILQGISGGLLAPMAQMMMARAAGKRLASVLGFAAMPILLAPILGPVIAGAILQFASWRWLFLINLPVGALAIVLAVVFLPNDREDAKPRGLDLVGLALLSPGLALFLYASDHVRERVGLLLLAAAVLLLVAFFRWAVKRRDEAIIDLRLFERKDFCAAVVTQFMSHGVMFAGQMMIPVYLMQAAGLGSSKTGLLLAPIGLGMFCGFPLVGSLVKRFGNRAVSASGAWLALAGTLPLVFLARHGLIVSILACALFIRGLGQSCISVPAVSAAYASVKRHDLPMATTALNVVMRIGGPTLTTISATFLGWQLAIARDAGAVEGAFQAAFVLLCVFHVLLVVAALRLPRWADGVPDEGHTSG